jgi:hypothetical protein
VLKTLWLLFFSAVAFAAPKRTKTVLTQRAQRPQRGGNHGNLKPET